MSQIAFVTYSGIREFKGADMTASDRLVADILGKQGIRILPAQWDDPSVNWEAFDLLILRACWNYNEHPAQFRQWLQSIERQGIKVLNPIGTVLWNMDKRYLLDMQSRDIPVPEMAFLAAGQSVALDNLMQEHQWDTAVIKPAIGLGGFNTWRTSSQTSDGHQERLDEQLTETDLILQRYQPEIATMGEWSLVFIDRVYSHAVHKRPGDGDFRVQPWLGGSQAAANPSIQLYKAAKHILEQIEGDLLYARVDMIHPPDDEPILMELELIEPDLFVDYHPDAPQRLADAIQRHLIVAKI